MHCTVIPIVVHSSLCHVTLLQQEKRRLKEVVRTCRRQYLRAFCPTDECDSDLSPTKKICRGPYDSGFPTTLVSFFSRYPGTRRFLGIKLALFSTAVDDNDMKHALSPILATIEAF